MPKVCARSLKYCGLTSSGREIVDMKDFQESCIRDIPFSSAEDHTRSFGELAA